MANCCWSILVPSIPSISSSFGCVCPSSPLNRMPVLSKTRAMDVMQQRLGSRARKPQESSRLKPLR